MEIVHLQSYGGRLYKVEELLEVLAFLYGYITIPELDGSLKRRFHGSWRRRTLIRSCRQSSVGRNLGYGYDWKGIQVRRYDHCIGDTFVKRWRPMSPNHCYPIKEDVLGYEKRKMLPSKVIAEAAKVILERDKAVWVRYSVAQQCKQSHPVPPWLQAAE